MLGDTSEDVLPAVVPKPQFDFDEDGKADIVVYRPGATAVKLSALVPVPEWRRPHVSPR